MKLQKLYTVAAMAAIALPALSRPATREVLTHVNPDGSTVQYRLHGDEKFSYVTSVDGMQLLEFKGNMLTPMLRNGAAMSVNSANLNMLKAQLPAEPEIETPQPAVKGARMADLDAQGRSKYPTIGNARACVILLEYADTPFISENPQEQFYRLCNEKGYSDYGSRGSAKDYFEACSGGKYSPTFDVYGPVKLSHPAAYYTGAENPKIPGSGKNGYFGYAIKEALEKLDDEVDFSIYDYDENDVIDNIFFFYSGYGQADTRDPNTIWPHQADFSRYTNYYPGTIGLDPIVIDGKHMATYACSCELNGSATLPPSKRPWLDGIGAFCHEYGHVLGLPDLYDVLNSGTSTPEDFSVMDHGSYNGLSTCPPLFSAYEKWVCGWLEYEDAADNSEYTLYPQASDQANAVRIRIPRPGTGGRYYSEYFVLEDRDNSGWDSKLPEHGMLLWHIDYDSSSWTSNQVNVNKTPKVELIGTGSNGGMAWPGQDANVDFITPSGGKLYSRKISKPISAVITDITFDYEHPTNCPVTFTYNKYQENNLKTVLGAFPYVDQDNRTFTLNWEEVPEATDYMLTVKRRNESGREYVVGALDNAKVGNVTSYTVDNISASQWNQTFTALVRVVSHLPSSETSNLITFVPANIDNSGVDGIDAESIMIYGGKGEIIAPAGARAFNLNGVETGLTDLSAGIYVVVYGGATAKVIVR